MSAISGTRRQIRELVDGSLEVRIHIDPRFKQDFHRLFPDIDAPIALAPLVADFERLPQSDKPKGGPLCQLAARWCKDEVFREWLGAEEGKTYSEEKAAAYIRFICGIESRSELDSKSEAAYSFNTHFRTPYMDFLKSTLRDSNV